MKLDLNGWVPRNIPHSMLHYQRVKNTASDFDGRKKDASISSEVLQGEKKTVIAYYGFVSVKPLS